MSEHGHTPGPWRVDGSPGVRQWIAAGESDLAVVFATDVQTRAALPLEANANLMAAAPDLLRAIEALRHLARCMATGPGWTQELFDEALKAADAAVEKTKGEP